MVNDRIKFAKGYWFIESQVIQDDWLLTPHWVGLWCVDAWRFGRD